MEEVEGKEKSQVPVQFGPCSVRFPFCVFVYILNYALPYEISTGFFLFPVDFEIEKSFLNRHETQLLVIYVCTIFILNNTGNLRLLCFTQIEKLFFGCLITFKNMQKQPPEMFKKAVFKSFAIFTGKHLCWNQFLVQNIAKYLRAPILKNICERLFLEICS